ncbi:HsdM family class I SAM-dependent methyltransferase [Pseudomonas sp. MWU318]|uniref:HsdM family class I SAM-dependent methyltransferase n=1 Tax=Pseudomonas sp. MWU318 TaxID=2802569 RepID=UPI001927D23D|nr:class I SAM-dependent DNA methyltransferase [Pseudomonas sp. MWU318]
MRLSQQQLEAHLWGAANILRGKTAGQDYKNYILSLMFYKRLCDQWEHEANEAIAEQERIQKRQLSEAQKALFRARGDHRFSIPVGSRWGDVLAESTNLGEKLTQAMRAVAEANDELRGVFTVDWNQPAPDGSGKPIIPNEVVHALIQHFDEHDLSNASVSPDVLGRAYEYLIKQFADDAGAKAGEFFTPPEVVDTLVRILEPQPGDTIYDPTCGSGGMLVHAADFLRENNHHATSAHYFGQEMNWGNAAIGKINSVLHGLEATIAAGVSTITDPAFKDEKGKVRKFSLVLANFPFSDEFWWLKPEQQTDDKKKKDKLKKEVFGKEGYKDPFARFGRGTAYKAPPAGYGDYAFILHILASLTDDGRTGIVCPQGVLFRGQAEVEEETGEFDDDGNPKFKRRKADDEHLIRKALLESRMIDAVISLPLNVFYGASVPACLVILKKQRPPERHDKLLLVYATRHYRELSNQNELRPQDVMRILVHTQAYGDATKVPSLVARHSQRIREQINAREHDQCDRLEVEYADHAQRLAMLNAQVAEAQAEISKFTTKTAKSKAEAALSKLEGQRDKVAAKIGERDGKIAEARRRADADRLDVQQAGVELGALYGDVDELLKHARVVGMDEVEENEFNLNIPRYVDTFEPEPRVKVNDALKSLRDAESALASSEINLVNILRGIGYETH